MQTTQSVVPAPDAVDKAGVEYWDNVWTDLDLQTPVDPRDNLPDRYPDRYLDKLFRQQVQITALGDRTLLEIGCANSAWLPYFAREFGFQITGLDYSDIGCAMERRLLERHDITGRIVCADLFAPPSEMVGAYDAVFSYGVAEHFEDTTHCIAAFANFLRPGGLMITVIPNMGGLVGLFQRLINREVFDKHVVLDDEQLRRAHEGAGLQVVESNYRISVHFGVVNPGQAIHQSGPIAAVKRFVFKYLYRFSKLVWLLQSKGVNFPETKLFSGVVICFARKL